MRFFVMVTVLRILTPLRVTSLTFCILDIYYNYFPEDPKPFSPRDVSSTSPNSISQGTRG